MARTDGKLPPGASVTNQRGKWIGRVRLPDDTRPGFTLGPSTGPDAMTIERAAEKFAAWLERGLVARVMAQKATTPEAARVMTIAVVVEKWLALIKLDAELKPSTRAAHKSHGKAIERRFGDRMPESIGSADLRAWIRDLNVGRAPTTVRNTFFSLSKMFDDAMAEEWIAEMPNPCRLPKVRDTLPDVLVPDDDDKARHTEAEARRIIAATTDPARRLRYLIAFTTGMRDGEIAGLRWRDVATKEGVNVFRVRGALALLGDDGWITRAKPKTGDSKRDQPIHPHTFAELTRWKTEGWAAYVGRKPGDDDPIVPAEDGSGDRPRSAVLFRVDLAAAGLPVDFKDHEGHAEPFEFKSTRRSFATWIEAHGAPDGVGDRLLGHSKKSVRTKHYAAPSMPTLARWVALIEIAPDNAVGQHEGTASPEAPEASAEDSDTLTESVAPPARFERTTFGLGIGRSGPHGSETGVSRGPRADLAAPNPLLSGALSSDGSEAEAVGRFVLGGLEVGLYDLRRDPLNAYSYHDVDDDGGDDGSA